MTVDQRVHQYLLAHEGEWICSLRLAQPTIGGLRAAARIHSLRAQGVRIESKTCACFGCKQRRDLAAIDGRRFSPVACYRLVTADSKAVGVNLSELNRAMLMIQSLDPDAHLEFSEWTGQWYVTARIHIGGDGLLRSITEHREGPDGAVFAFFGALREVGTSSESVLVTNDGDRERRRHHRWNGAAFVEVPIPAPAVSA